ncbi:Nitrilase/cyanide hydratase and apolipoprotein N-acyltransferase [Ammonifex degensii KC4]|uniref:Nitrilase/cyanide hydratase and apolipoprotein N-acyltransferase n=1 Tax=Ammonifex degensii (strain DSM 10501 / KC4) TaxID=429009 RepID=C9R9L9_AMMDK|nr:carbon-nitrogen hydrolase family protein [Ammonifex degensii]ACX52998.1 Nitrilase/cyanide hydratase and apolipoprotein N-acyltransferase [Ammonifex degensii KC4]
MASKVCAAICQLRVTADKKANLARAGELIRLARDQGAELVVLSEMFVCPYANHLFPLYAESFPAGEALSFLSSVAREERIYLVGGSLPEKEGDYLYNTSFVFDPEGKLIARYRKIHLFDVDLPHLRYRESEVFQPGKEVVVFPTPWGKVGLAICFDLRFPSLFREMVRRGAKIIAVPAAYNLITGPAHWELLVRSRALDNQAYLLGAAPARDYSAPYVAFGHSLIVSPWAEVLARAGAGEEVLTVTLDLDYLERVRRELPVLIKD